MLYFACPLTLKLYQICLIRGLRTSCPVWVWDILLSSDSLPTIIASGAALKLLNVFSITIIFVMARLLSRSLGISLGSADEKCLINARSISPPCIFMSISI